MSVVTFDFDDTLTETQWDNEEECFIFMGPNRMMCQTLRACLHNGDEVHIVTSRVGPEMDADGRVFRHGQPGVKAFIQEHLADVADQISGVHFTGGSLKFMTLHELRSTKHFDDDRCELEALPPGIQGILVPTLHGMD